jgi:hypothetical protein
MKPLEFSLDDMRDLLAVLDELESGAVDAPRRQELLARLDTFAEATAARCAALREQMEMAEEFGGQLRAQRSKHTATPEQMGGKR